MRLGSHDLVTGLLFLLAASCQFQGALDGVELDFQAVNVRS